MEDKREIEIAEKKYLCEKTVSNDYENNIEINETMEMLRTKLRSMHFTVGMNPVEFEMYIYHSREINAFSVKEFDGYVIAISSGFFSTLKDELQSYLLNRDIRDYFYGGKKNAKWHMEHIFKFILLFVSLHEYYHILNGHCNTEYVKNNVAIEYYRKMEKEQSLYSQVLEFDADYCAVRSSMYFIEEETNDYTVDVMMFGFGLYFIFLKFQENFYEGFHTLNVLDALSHPPAGIRLTYAFFKLTYEVGNYLDGWEEYFDLLNKLMELCIYFDRIYYDASTIDLSLCAIAYTKKGLRHIENLHNGWNKVRLVLDKYSYVDLKQVENLSLLGMDWIDSSGKMMNEKIVKNFISFQDQFVK